MKSLKKVFNNSQHDVDAVLTCDISYELFDRMDDYFIDMDKIRSDPTVEVVVHLLQEFEVLK